MYKLINELRDALQIVTIREGGHIDWFVLVLRDGKLLKYNSICDDSLFPTSETGTIIEEEK